MALLWLLWFIVPVLGVFAVLELIGYERFGLPGTLSTNVRNLGKRHPISIFWLGMTVGVLAMHFWAETCSQ